MCARIAEHDWIGYKKKDVCIVKSSLEQAKQSGLAFKWEHEEPGSVTQQLSRPPRHQCGTERRSSICAPKTIEQNGSASFFTRVDDNIIHSGKEIERWSLKKTDTDTDSRLCNLKLIQRSAVSLSLSRPLYNQLDTAWLFHWHVRPRRAKPCHARSNGLPADPASTSQWQLVELSQLALTPFSSSKRHVRR